MNDTIVFGIIFFVVSWQIKRFIMWRLGHWPKPWWLGGRIKNSWTTQEDPSWHIKSALNHLPRTTKLYDSALRSAISRCTKLNKAEHKEVEATFAEAFDGLWTLQRYLEDEQRSTPESTQSIFALDKLLHTARDNYLSKE